MVPRGPPSSLCIAILYVFLSFLVLISIQVCTPVAVLEGSQMAEKTSGPEKTAVKQKQRGIGGEF
jgi:hypothetical protein